MIQVERRIRPEDAPSRETGLIADTASRRLGVWGQAQVRKPGKEPVNGDPYLHPRERRTEAGVRARAKRQVVDRVGTPDVELRGLVEDRLVSITRSPHQQHDRSGGDRYAGDLRIDLGQPRRPLRRRLQAQGLLERLTDEPPVADYFLALVGMTKQQEHRQPNGMRCRDDASTEKRAGVLSDDIEVELAVALDLQRSQLGQDIVARVGAAGFNGCRQVAAEAGGEATLLGLRLLGQIAGPGALHA
jgi:hypothetical protein